MSIGYQFHSTGKRSTVELTDQSEFEEFELEAIDLDLQVSKNGIKLDIYNLEKGIDYKPVDLVFENFNKVRL